jgi:hypothetical protein
MEKYQSKIQSIEYFASENLLIQTWSKESNNTADSEFIAEMLQLADYITQTKPKKLLVDMREFKFPVAPEQQDWINQNVNQLLVELHTKTAFVVSPDLFTSVSVEQTLNDKEGKKVNNRFFEDYQNAKNWLNI